MKKLIPAILLLLTLSSCTRQELDDVVNGSYSGGGQLIVNYAGSRTVFTGYDLNAGEVVYAVAQTDWTNINASSVSQRKSFTIMKYYAPSDPYVALLMDTRFDANGNLNNGQPLILDTIQMTINVSGDRASGSFSGRRYSGTFTNIKYIP